MKRFTLQAASLIVLMGMAGISNAQITFNNSNTLLHSDAGVAGSNAGNHCSNSTIVVDVNNDGLDDIVKLDENRYVRIEYQQVGGGFTYQYIGDFNPAYGVWGASMADVDHNGYKDFLLCMWNTGGNAVRLMKLNGTGTGVLGAIVTLPTSGIASQNGNFLDINNDGWEDIFVCNDVGASKAWINDGAGNFTFDNNSTINFNGPESDDSGNYGSVATDFDNDGDVDLYIAHCRQGYPSGDPRRTNQLFINNGNGTYQDSSGIYNGSLHGLASNDQDWTSSFGDIDNDGDFDLLLTGHETGNTTRVMENDGNGNFSLLLTIPVTGNAYESHMEDFDNDGFIDIWISGSSIQHALFRNNGNNTFTQVSNATLGPITVDNILSASVGDLNHDGKMDLYASYGNSYNTPSASRDDILYLNTTSNSNHFLTLDLRGVTSTAGALGARAFIYGGWGVQTREVRAGESYGNMNTFQLHFGLGSATTIDSIVVNWPAGSQTKLICPVPADQFITLTEGAPVCTLSCAGITVTPGGPTTFCSGDSTLLSAPTGAGYNYLWSNGSTDATTYVNSAGSYSVEVSTGPGCSATSPSVAITVDPVESVSISAGGATTFCPGGSVLLTSTQASGNTWTTSETTQSITVNATGTYSTSYQGLCQAWPSNSISVTVLDGSAPTTTDDNVIYPAVGTVTAAATTTDIDWYDAPTGGTLLGSGANYSPGVITNDQTYYAEAIHTYGASTGNNVGSTNIAAATANASTLNGFLKFDVLANCNLVSVQCSTAVAGDRVVELRNNLGAVLLSDTITFTTGTQTITLNFPLTPGTDYQLGTNSAFNTATYGFINSQLVRETGASYPYTLPSVINITTGNNGSSDVTAFYYFFNWVVDVDPTNVCVSTRTPATIFVTPGSGIETNDGYTVSVYPNPTTDFVNVELTTPVAGDAMISIFDILGKKIYDVNLGSVNGTVIKTISTQTFAKGVYTIQLKVNDQEFSTRVIVK